MAPPMLIRLPLTPETPKIIGASGGWLAFPGDRKNPEDPFLLCPFSGTRILLPPNQTLPRIHPHVLSNLEKLVLCGDPSHDFTALAIHSTCDRAGVAFCRPSLDERWAQLDSQIQTVYDLICCHETRTVFLLGPGPTVEAWDLGRAGPRKKTEILGNFCPHAAARARERYPHDLYTTRWYLARPEFAPGSITGQLFVVVRYVGEFVRYDGVVVTEGDTLTDYASEPLVCPYKTMGFDVFKYDDGKWVAVQTLGGEAIFLGGNETVMVGSGGGLKGDSIYFTDDYWERMDEDYCYGGHDMGVYKMEDGSIEPLFPLD